MNENVNNNMNEENTINSTPSVNEPLNTEVENNETVVTESIQPTDVVSEPSTPENEIVDTEEENTESLENTPVQLTPEEEEKKIADEIKRIESQGIEINPKIKKTLRNIIIIGIIFAAVFYIFLNPIIKFKSYEKTMIAATQKYYEINPDKVPTGNRTATLTLQKLFTGRYIKDDFFMPFAKEPCSATKSWVKTRSVNNETKYYAYLYCGKLFQSKVDHEGPVITLNGDTKITINKGEKFEDPGVKSVKDSSDGDLGTDVTVDGKVNVNKVGKQTITYTAYDYLSNKTTVTREIIVVERLFNAIKDKTKNGLFEGTTDNNYIVFGRNLYRIVGFDSNNNVQITSNGIVGNVNYDGLDDYLETYYNALPEESKKLIVESKYCNSTLTENDYKTTECKSYTDKRKVYIPSTELINKTTTDGTSYLHEFQWTANPKDKSNAFIITDLISESDNNYMVQDNNSLYGVKPLLTIKGNLLLKSGDGTYENPYVLRKDKQEAKQGEKVYDRIPGEYIIIDGTTWRILKTEPEEPTKIISGERLLTPDGYDFRDNSSEDKSEHFIYNPKKKGNIAYKINNQSSRYLNSKYLVKHEIEVPIYKNRVLTIKI